MHWWNLITDDPRFNARGKRGPSVDQVRNPISGQPYVVGQQYRSADGRETWTLLAIEHSPACVRWGACSPDYRPPTPVEPLPPLERELHQMLCSISGALAPRYQRLIAGALDRTEPDERIVLRGTGRAYVHSGMFRGVHVTKIRARYTDGSERDLYLLTEADVGEDADVHHALYESLAALQAENPWLREAFA